jgi:hypothetical protein
MHFCEQTPRDEWNAERLRVLHFSLNTAVVAIDELPVGPARAGVALCEDPEGAIRLEIAVRSLRTGQVVSYAPDEDLDGERDVFVAVDAALSFAEGMGFLFDEDEIAAHGEDGLAEAAARWRELLAEVSERDAEPAPGELPKPPALETAPVLELVREVSVQENESGPELIDVRNGDEVVLADITVPAESTVDAAAAPELVLSKFRLVMGAIEPRQDEEETAAPDGKGAIAAPVTPLGSRIRLLSRF